WVHVQLHQQKGMISLSPPTICNSALESPYWNVKGNFFCYLNDHNENTIVDPSVIYFDFANPLQAQEV
ncbi:hypothetical protein, partial [Escherichia coli]|uniref:hypothetical protein n=1 Tax=Escherichia coli TaxID=562 RepID=UPI002FE26C70